MLRHGAARDRAVALDRMSPVGRDVDEVIDRIDGPREQAEHSRRPYRAPRHMEIERGVAARRHSEDVLVEEHRSENEEVLDPLMRAKRANEAAHQVALFEGRARARGGT